MKTIDFHIMNASECSKMIAANDYYGYYTFDLNQYPSAAVEVPVLSE